MIANPCNKSADEMMGFFHSARQMEYISRLLITFLINYEILPSLQRIVNGNFDKNFYPKTWNSSKMTALFRLKISHCRHSDRRVKTTISG